MRCSSIRTTLLVAARRRDENCPLRISDQPTRTFPAIVAGFTMDMVRVRGLIAATCRHRPPVGCCYQKRSIRCLPEHGEGGLHSTRAGRPLDGDTDHPLEEGL